MEAALRSGAPSIAALLRDVRFAATRRVETIARRLLREFVWREREFLARQVLLDTAFGFVDDCRVAGDYLEFGSGRGGSLIDAFDAIRRRSRLRSMRLYVFDSFEGLPEPLRLDSGRGIGGGNSRVVSTCTWPSW